MSNTIESQIFRRVFKTPGVRFSVSSRHVRPKISIIDYLKIFYMYLDIHQIESVFGSTIFPSRLYGGRPFQPNRSLTDLHIRELEERGINISLTLTNHYFDEDAYNHTRELLERHHKAGNSVICVNDELAGRIKRDFPGYILKASIVKQIDTIKKVERYLELYDLVVLPMDKNDDDAFLRGIKEKERVILFGNANCAYTCPARSCYLMISQREAGKPVTAACSRKQIPRLEMGNVYFDIKKFKEMGFSHFKLVPLSPGRANHALRYFNQKRNRGERGEMTGGGKKK